MSNYILESVKNYLGIDKSCSSFDEVIVMNINGVISKLYQIGVDPVYRSIQANVDEKWDDIFANDLDLVDMIKNYVFLNVKVSFDPPSNSFVLDAMNKQIQEFEWRINIEAEGGFDYDEPDNSRRKKKFYDDF